MAQLQVGDSLPAFTFKTLVDDAVKTVTTDELFKGKKAVLFAIPGAFTPTCTKDHCPSYLLTAAKLKAKGVDLVACTSTNDAFVLGAFSTFLKADGKITFLADGNAAWAKLIGMENDLTAMDLGVRTKRYAMIVEDGVVKHIGVESARGIANSGADAMLEHL